MNHYDVFKSAFEAVKADIANQDRAISWLTDDPLNFDVEGIYDEVELLEKQDDEEETVDVRSLGISFDLSDEKDDY